MRNKWLIGGLIVSAIVNLLLIGFVVGRIASDSPPPFGPVADPTAGYMRYLRTLPEDRRKEIAPTVREHMRGLRDDIRGTRGDQRALHAAIVAEPFDAAELTAALERLQRRLTSVQSQSHASFVAVVARLNLAEREALARSMQRPHRGHGPHDPRHPDLDNMPRSG